MDIDKRLRDKEAVLPEVVKPRTDSSKPKLRPAILSMNFDIVLSPMAAEAKSKLDPRWRIVVGDDSSHTLLKGDLVLNGEPVALDGWLIHCPMSRTFQYLRLTHCGGVTPRSVRSPIPRVESAACRQST